MASDARLATLSSRGRWPRAPNLLQQHLGLGKPIEKTLLGEPVGAQGALRLGPVTRVGNPTELDAATDELATRPTAATG